VPDLVRILRQRDALEFLLPRLVEETNLNFGGMGGEHTKVRPGTVPSRSTWMRTAFLDSVFSYLDHSAVSTVVARCTGDAIDSPNPRRWRKKPNLAMAQDVHLPEPSRVVKS
jgi:hypothetical protein